LPNPYVLLGGGLEITQRYISNEPPITNWPDTHLIEACVRVAVRDCPARIPPRFLTDLENNEKLATCCRTPADHDISAWYSCPDDQAKGVPDVYVLHCTCGRVHRRFMLGGALGGQGQAESDEAFAKRKARAAPGVPIRQWKAESDEAYAHRKGREKRPFWEIR